VVNQIALFAAVIAAINIAVFFALPGDSLALQSVGYEPLTLLTFQFVHFGMSHLLENLLGLLFTAALAIELDMDPRTFILAYFVGVFIAVPLLISFPAATIAGNSTGIFGALAATLARAKPMLPTRITYPVAILFIFSLTSYSLLTCGNCALSTFRADIFHFAGFVTGAAVSFTSVRKHW